MRHVEPGHVLVCDFRIHSDQVRMVQCGDQREISASGWHVDISAWFVWLRFKRKLVIVFLVQRIVAKIVQRISQSFYCFICAPAAVSFHTFASAPENKDLRATLHPEIHCAHRLLQSVVTNRLVVGSKRAVPKDRIVKKIDSCHRHDDTVFLTRATKLIYDLIALLW